MHITRTSEAASPALRRMGRRLQRRLRRRGVWGFSVDGLDPAWVCPGQCPRAWAVSESEQRDGQKGGWGMYVPWVACPDRASSSSADRRNLRLRHPQAPARPRLRQQIVFCSWCPVGGHDPFSLSRVVRTGSARGAFHASRGTRGVKNALTRLQLATRICGWEVDNLVLPVGHDKRSETQRRYRGRRRTSAIY